VIDLTRYEEAGEYDMLREGAVSTAELGERL